MSGFKMTGTDPDPNASDFQRADRDPDLTRAVEDGPPDQESTAAAPDESGMDTLGSVRPAYAEDNVEEIDQDPGDQGATTPPHSPNSWVGEDDGDGIFRSADPYAQQGLQRGHDRAHLEPPS